MLFFDKISYAASIYPIINAKRDTLQISIAIDQVTALAGIKLSISYGKEDLKFKSAKKTKETSQFMHVVNDKNPGKVIIVMASAKGISGKNLRVVDLTFTLLKEKLKEKDIDIDIDHVELMSEELLEIPVDIRSFQEG